MTSDIFFVKNFKERRPLDGRLLHLSGVDGLILPEDSALLQIVLLRAARVAVTQVGGR